MSATILQFPYTLPKPIYSSMDDLPDITDIGQALVNIEVFYPPARSTFNAPLYNEVPEACILRFAINVSRAKHMAYAHGGTTRTGISLEVVK